MSEGRSREMTRVIYIPGLGDKKQWLLWLQKVVLKGWRRQGLHVEMLAMRWADPMPLQPRYETLLQRIDTLHKEGKQVVLVGISAGASVAVSAYADRKNAVHGVVTICGKLQGDIPEVIEELNPCFADALQKLETQKTKLKPKERRQILTLRAWRDAIVPTEEATFDGVTSRVLPMAGHNITCSIILLTQAKRIARFLRNSDKH